MKSDFSRILTLLRNERGISQKDAAKNMNILQASLSHYENGRRECPLDTLIKIADFYEVSCDYLLGRSPERSGGKIYFEDIPEPDALGKENNTKNIMATLNKKIISNSINVVYDLLIKTGNNQLIKEASSFLMIAIYKIFRGIHSINPKNQLGMFTLPEQIYQNYADATMKVNEANFTSTAKGHPVHPSDKITQLDDLYITSEILAKNYPMFASSLLNVIHNSEKNIGDLTGIKSEK